MRLAGIDDLFVNKMTASIVAVETRVSPQTTARITAMRRRRKVSAPIWYKIFAELRDTVNAIEGLFGT